MQDTTLKPAAPAVELKGQCAPKYEPIRKTFEANFTDHGEVGASLALFVGGELVVDLWGGWRDKAQTQPWTRDTLACIWSATKAINAVCFAMLVDRRLASYEDKVSRHWPAFGAAGKENVTIGQLLSHQSGVSGFTDPALVEDLFAGEPSAARLAAQAPIWEPGSAAGYHAFSVGILSTSLFRRIEGRSIKQFVAEELAGPFGLDVFIGVPPEEDARRAEMLPIVTVNSANYPRAHPAQAASRNPAIQGALANSAAFRAADLPAANGFSTASSLAGLLNLMLLHAGRNGQRLLRPETAAEAIRPRSEGIDLVKTTYTRWAAGFTLSADGHYGPNPRTFGHSGWGGTFVLADPDRDFVIAYTMNRMSDLFDADPRRKGMIQAIYDNV